MARILVVDPEQKFLDFVQDTIKKYASEIYKSEYSLVTNAVTNTKEALELVQRNNYELIIIEASLGQAHDFEFIKEVRKKFPQLKVPIVVVSPISSINLQYQSLRNGASAWFKRSTSAEKFAKEVLKLIQGN